MKTAILYYTLGGSTKKEAERLSKELNAPSCRIFEARKRGMFRAFMPGCLHAMKRKAVKIKPITMDLNDYDRIVIGAPVWAAYPAPVFNSMVELLPANKEVELYFCEAGNDHLADEAGTTALITNRGCTVANVRYITTGEKPSKMKE
jgi:flavodoxin